MKRLLDIVASGLGLIVLSPLFVIIAIWIKLDSKGPVFYRQVRVGRWNKDFRIFKFRSMRVGADKGSLVTIGDRDPRITRSGYFIRKFKFDELPQLINVFLGDMSLVGPRPEVRHYVNYWTPEQMHVLDVRPGITDPASIKFINENELMEKAEDPEKYYIEVIMQDKIRLYLQYVENHSFLSDIGLIVKTFGAFDKVINRYFSKRSLPYWLVLMLDSAILVLTGVFAFWMFNRYIYRFFNWDRAWHSIILFVILSMVGFKLFRTYSSVIRYSSFADLMKVAYANLLNMVLAIGVSQWIYYCHIRFFHYFYIRHTVTIFCISTLLMLVMRILIKKLYEVVAEDNTAMRTLIYGSMEGGVALAKSIRAQRPAKFILKGFITHDGTFRNHVIMGVGVYEANEKLEAFIKQSKIDALLVSPLRVKDFQGDQSLQDMLINAGVKIFMASNLKEWKAGEDMSDVQLKEVSVDDLMPREEIVVDMVSISRALSGTRVLITGAAGSIGSELVRQVAACKPESMILIDQAETPQHDISLMMDNEFPDVKSETIVTSICKQKRMEEIFSAFKPDFVFHAAAYKHVPMMEDNPSEAIQNNVYGTKVIADLSDKYGVKKFVMVSTDKAVNPTNVMGCSKRICEIYVQALNKVSDTQFVTTRFGNVLGSNGSVIPLFKEQIKRGGPVTVTDERIVRFFMLIPEACKLVLEAGTKGKGGEIFVFDMGKPVKIVDLARRMIQLSNAKDVEIKFTGLRPGEKLYEEVLNELEGTKPSFHEKIRIAEVREYDYDAVCKQIDELIELSKNYDDMATVAKMKEIVPEYKSNNSIYESLDK